ncbi:sigma 54-interacting transcriptional regulator [Fusibacter paucivorans]|uniref:Sigma 54-interacting transcriptional regulator n=1 Tax=Fusibacter paucivorans TaxID=76009 RepID=A0ABS5PLX2_9FIRM|nr:sigma 54-interacting transcriptional regulator [Fusibacter paucivorans]MBS7525351.1 sigma 54-interacting transcriptional regulator [Fusibacter paucivorans]
MDNLLKNEWKSYHEDTNRRAMMRDIVRTLWQEDDQREIDYRHALPKKMASTDYQKAKQRARRLYVYANSVIKHLEKTSQTSNIGVAIFDNDGCLLKLFGKAEFTTWAADHHIEIGTIWRSEFIGTNIFTVGDRLQARTSLIGAENYAAFLLDTACYVAHVSLDNGIKLGSVVVMTRYEDRSPYLSNLVMTISRLIELQMFWLEITEISTGIIEGYGIISLDQSNGDNRVLTMSKEVFHILGLQSRNVHYEYLEAVIHNSGENGEFFAIINEKRIVNDLSIRLNINGRQVGLTISTYAFKENKFHMDGLIIAINSMKRINTLLSKYSVNTARVTFDEILGKSDVFLATTDKCRVASKSGSHVLLLGESGVGKDVLAQAIHNESHRRLQPFVALNCASLSKELISSELFGYEEGAFTGAKKGGNIGKFEMANNGTLFLDEIGDMPLDLQAFLLRVLEEKSFMKIGGDSPIHVDVRIIAATNKDLKKLIQQGRFREDLFYRLGIVRIHIPPLRRRAGDALLLADAFIEQICKRHQRPQIVLSDTAKAFMSSYDWPGNVREVQNMLEGIISTQRGNLITRDDINRYLAFDNALEQPVMRPYRRIEGMQPVAEGDIYEALRLCNNNRTRAAAYLGISRRTLYRRLAALEDQS